MITFQNLDLITVSFVVAATAVIGFMVFFSNRQSITNRTFLVFSLITLSWGIVNYSFYNINNMVLSLWVLRLVLFFAVWQAFSLFQLFFVFPTSEITFPWWYKRILIPLVVLASILVLTPLVLDGIKELSSEGRISAVYNGPAMPLFGLLSVLLVLGGFYFLLRKIWLAPKVEQKPYWFILIGALTTFGLIIVFNLVLPAAFDNSKFVPFGAIFFFPFIASTSYAILRHKLFNVRAMWAGVLVFLLAVTSFFEVIFAGELSLILYRGAIFLLILFFGILIIKGIIREAKQREEIQELASRLKNVNNILAHDIKNVLGKNRDIFVEALAGTFGEITDQGKSFFKRLNMDTGDLITSVMNILKSGDTMKSNPQPFNFKEAVLDAVASVKDKADEGKIKIEIKIDEKEDYMVTADRSLIVPHVLKNLIENAINYSVQNSSVFINLSKKDLNTILLVVKDTGWGMTEEDKKNLFKPGGHGPDSIKKNVHTSGFGLSIAKQTMDIHNGKVYGISDGRDKGSTFFVELPVYQITQEKVS